MFSSSVPLAIMVLAGAMVALQAPINATVSRAAGSPVNATLVSFLVGTVALGILVLSLRIPLDSAAIRQLPWWAWLGGLCGAAFVSGAAYAMPKLGVASALTIAIGAQLLTAVLLDHAGAFGQPMRQVTWSRALGVMLVAVGATIVRRG